MKTIHNVKCKLVDNYAIITKADKGSTVVILDQHEYKANVYEFIKDNNIRPLTCLLYTSRCV